MINREFLIAVLSGEIDDDVIEEAVLYYNIRCPYYEGDNRAYCLDDDEIDRAVCFACKLEWLDSEVDS